MLPDHKKGKAMAHKLEEEVNSHPDLSFQLERPAEIYTYRVLHCENCGNDTNFEIAITDVGQWCIECLACDDAAAMLDEIVNKLK